MRKLFKNKRKRMVSTMMGLVLAASTLLNFGSTVAFAADEPAPQAPANGEKIWSVDAFDAEYSSGYFCITNSHGHNCTDNGTWYWNESDCSASNTSRDASIYIDHYSGACMNGTYFDIREYVWTENNQYWSVSQSGANGVRGTADASITREFHFYEEGTLASNNPVEVTFKGVMCLQDMDIEEGYTFEQGLVGAWLNAQTHVTKRDSKTWKGTWENHNDGVNTERETLWVEVEGTPSKPLTITYWGNVGHGSAVNYYGSSVTYKLVENSRNALPEGAEPAVGTHCATYAAYNLMPAEEFIRYAFDGWYTDKDLTNKSAETVMVSSDLTFYGTYIKVAGLIETEVTHGTITPTDECFEYGGNKAIEYAPEEGYLLESVTVDGKKVDITEHPSSYVFEDVQDDHKISVVYVKASMDKEVQIKDSDCLENYADGQAIDGTVIKNGDVVTYMVSFENPTGAARDVVISDIVPEGADVLENSISDSGILKDNTVVWNLAVPAYTSGKVSFDCRITDAAKGKIVKNNASVTFKALDPDGSEKDVTLDDTVNSPVLADPVKSVLNADGKDITDKIVADGQKITYVITFENPAEKTKRFTVTDKIPEGVTLDGDSISDNGSEQDGIITWTVDVAAGETKTVAFSVTVNIPAKDLTKILNQAKVAVDFTEKDTVTSAGPDGEPETPVYVLDDPEKSVFNADGINISQNEKGEAVQTVKQAGDVIEYQISFQNPTPDGREFTVTDKLPEGVAFVSADNNGSYDAESHTVTWMTGLDGGQKRTVSVKVEILQSAEGRILKNYATVSVDDARKDTNTVETPVIPVPEKDVVSEPGGDSINTMPVQAGENIYYTVTYQNPSDDTKTAVITDQLPEGVKFVSADNKGVYDAESHTVKWSIDTEAHAQVTVTVKVKVLASASGTDLNNQAKVLMDEADITTVTKNGDKEDGTTSNYVPAKYVLDADGEDIDGMAVAVGDMVTYRITYKNDSESTRKVVITDILPQGVTYMESSDGGKVQSIVHGQTVTWELEADARSEGAVTVTVKVTGALKGQAFANSATVEMTDEATGQTKTVTTEQVINYVLEELEKSVWNENGTKDLNGETVESGTVLMYRITVKNTGVEEKTFVVTDEIPEGCTFVSAKDGGTYEDGIVTWNLSLAGGESKTVSFLVQTTDKAEGTSVQNIAGMTCDGKTLMSNRVKTYVKESVSDKPDDGEKKPSDDNSTPSGTTGNGTNDPSGNSASGSGKNPSGTGSTVTASDGPKTGDDFNPVRVAALAVLALAAGIGFGIYAVRKGKEDDGADSE